MRLLRIAVLSVLGLGCLSAPPAGAAARALAGTNVITVTRASYIDVRIPRQVTLRTPFDASPDLSVAGGAPLAAFVLSGTDSRTRSITVAGGASTVDGRTARFLLPVRPFPDSGSGTYEDWKTYADVTTLPAGAYRLYVVSSGRATITLRLPGLTGKAALTPARTAKAEVAAPDHEVTAADARENVYAASTTATLARRGFALQVFQAYVEAEAAWQLVMCHNNPAESAVDQLRDTPGCPAGEKHTVVNHRYPGVTPDTKLYVQAFHGLPAGEHGLSTVYTSESYGTAAGYRTVWLEY